MALLYDRRIRVKTAGLTIENLRITLEVSREIDPTQNTGTVVIHNLSPENESLIYKAPDRITVEAGYPETQALVFDGFIEQVSRVRERLSRQTVIKLADSMRGGEHGDRKRLGGMSVRAYEGSVSIRQIVTDISTDLGLPIANIEIIPEGATWYYWRWSSRADAALTIALRRVRCTWFEQDGVIRINRPKPAGDGAEVQGDAPTIPLNPETGLIDRVVETDDGAEAYSLLNPAIVIGCRIDLSSAVFPASSWKVVALTHAGGNWTGDQFRTWVDLRRIAA